MCIVAENSKKLVISDYLGVKSYFSLHLVRRIPKNWDIPQVLLLPQIGEEDYKKLGYFASFTGIFIKITNFSTAFPKYLGNSTHFTANS